MKVGFYDFRGWIMALLMLLTLLSSGCSLSSKVTKSPDFNFSPEQKVVYIIPFTNTLVPESVSELVFNNFVDQMNQSRKASGVEWFFIMKDDQQYSDPDWLAKQTYMTGEIWSYIEDKGCCSTELRVRARVRLYEPGKPNSTLELFIPAEGFFENDNSTIEKERFLLAGRLAREMSKQLTKALSTSR
jgi:hypothetical protein